MKRASDDEPITAAEQLAHARARLARLSRGQAIRLPQTLALRAKWRACPALASDDLRLSGCCSGKCAASRRARSVR